MKQINDLQEFIEINEIELKKEFYELIELKDLLISKIMSLTRGTYVPENIDAVNIKFFFRFDFNVELSSYFNKDKKKKLYFTPNKLTYFVNSYHKIVIKNSNVIRNLILDSKKFPNKKKAKKDLFNLLRGYATLIYNINISLREANIKFINGNIIKYNQNIINLLFRHKNCYLINEMIFILKNKIFTKDINFNFKDKQAICKILTNNHDMNISLTFKISYKHANNHRIKIKETKYLSNFGKVYALCFNCNAHFIRVKENDLNIKYIFLIVDEEYNAQLHFEKEFFITGINHILISIIENRSGYDEKQCEWINEFKSEIEELLIYYKNNK